MRNGSWRASWLEPRLRRSLTPAPSEAGIDGITLSSLRAVIGSSFRLRRKARLRCEQARTALRGDQTVIAAVGRDCKTFGVDEIAVRDADEAEELAHELRLRMVVAKEAPPGPPP